jgi:prophage tail gpP-like protein
MYLVAENVSDVSALKERAEWEANIRMARSRQYSCVIDTHTVRTGTPLWFNRTAMVIDDNAAINETMLIKSVTFKENLNEGVETAVDFVVANAYTLELAAPVSTQDANSIGDPFAGEQLTGDQINEAAQEWIDKSADDKLNGRSAR